MRLVTFETAGGPRAGVVVADETLVPASHLVPGAPDDMVALIAAGAGLHTHLGQAARSARGGVALASTRLLAPIPRPARNVFCVGWNYSEHFAEGAAVRVGAGAPGQQEVPEFPALFSKNPATVTGHDAPIWHPAPHSDQLDWEVELAVVIGRTARYLASAEDALACVGGYAVVNDVSEREFQIEREGQWDKGKNCETFNPLGPWLVTADEVPDPQNLGLRLWVNGEKKQDGTTKDMAFGVAELVRYLSRFLVLYPGDVINTGTPAGVALGQPEPKPYLRAGDVVELEIDGLGRARQRLVAA